MTRPPPRCTPLYSSAASDVYKRQPMNTIENQFKQLRLQGMYITWKALMETLSLIHISEPTRLRRISYAVFCLKKKKKTNHKTSGDNRANRERQLYKKNK